MNPFPPESDDFSLEGQTALVTGASRGIGEEVATWLALAGARVALLARTREALEKVASRIGNDSFAVPCDVTDASSVQRALAQVRETIGGAPDVIVNNAGLFTIKAIDETPVAEFESQVAANLTAPFRLIREFLPDMRSRGSGHIVTIGSVADRQIFEGNGAYAATKFGARAMHEVLRAETRGTGVRATLISPASVDTDIWDPIQYYGSADKPDRRAMLDRSAVGNAVMFAVTQPANVNIDELRLSRS